MIKKNFLSIFLLFFAAANAMAGDTLTISNIGFEKKLPGGSSTVNIDFPLGDNNAVRRAVVDYIYEGLQFFSGVQIAYPPNTCDEPTFKTFLEEYTQALCQITAEEQQEYVRFGDEPTTLPLAIATGYLILKKVLTHMGRLQ